LSDKYTLEHLGIPTGCRVSWARTSGRCQCHYVSRPVWLLGGINKEK